MRISDWSADVCASQVSKRKKGGVVRRQAPPKAFTASLSRIVFHPFSESLVQVMKAIGDERHSGLRGPQFAILAAIPLPSVSNRAAPLFGIMYPPNFTILSIFDTHTSQHF